MDKMKEHDIEEYDKSVYECIKNGINLIVHNPKTVFVNLCLPTVLIALAITITIGGNIGVVKMDYVNYMPYHVISEVYVAKYIIGVIVSLLLLLLWRGTAFLMLADIEETSSFKRHKLKISDVFYVSLRLLQYCLLSFLTFGVVAAILIYLSVAVSSWLWIVAAGYMLFISVPFFVSCYGYMLNDMSFRNALREGLLAIIRQWGRVFVRLFLVYVIVGVLVVVFALPAAALMIGVYDNATAVVMSNASATPIGVYVLEYIAFFFSCVCSLFFVFAGMCVGKFIFDDTKAHF